ncbi:hypothetical protein DMUE_4527 [Dictyocoela muelleri]|nr:hypothetical protein DMUE_4527 [Dictyocoela muelleri]
MVKEILTEFGIDMKKHVISCITDGASVMIKFGKESGIRHQQCLAYAIHLAVTKTLYKKISLETTDQITSKREQEESEENALKYLENDSIQNDSIQNDSAENENLGASSSCFLTVEVVRDFRFDTLFLDSTQII